MAICGIRYFQTEFCLCLATRGVYTHDRPQGYYEATKASLIETINMMNEMGDEKIDKATFRWNKIQEYLKTHDYIMSVNVLDLCEISVATANNILSTYVSEGTYQYIN